MSREGVAVDVSPQAGTGPSEAPQERRVDTSRFFGTMTEIIRAPRQFFTHLEDTQENYRNSLRYLAFAALFHTMVSVTYFFSHKLAMAGILMINAMLLPALLALLCMVTMNMLMGAGVTFKRVFSIYAFASGTVMPVSWIPSLQIFTEPIRALLVCVGLVKACGLRWWQAVMALFISVVVFLLLIWSALPVLMQLKTLVLGA
ncbi:MAG: YIP1 family protein [Desulfovibrio sp.]|jgi:hypothetical protein|nr:YIP1 family protein [Desulfovibrio sp.]